MPNLFSKTAPWYDAIYRKADQTGMAGTIVTIATDQFGPHRLRHRSVARVHRGTHGLASRRSRRGPFDARNRS